MWSDELANPMNAERPTEPDYRLLLQSAPDLYIVLATDAPRYTIVDVSDSALRATNTRRETLIGYSIFEAFPANPADPEATGVPTLYATLRRALSSRSFDAVPIQRYDIPLRVEGEDVPHDGNGSGRSFEERWWSALTFPVVAQGGDLAYIILRIEDVTEFIRLRQVGAKPESGEARTEKMESEIFNRAQEVQQAADNLRRKNEEITRLYRKTRELEELKTQFFANVSHELRTPLTLILGRAERLLAALAGAHEARREVESIIENANALHHHVDNLLDVTKLEAGKLEPSYTDIELDRLARFVAGLFEPLAKDRDVAFRIDVTDGLRGQADIDKLQRVMMNLLSNAFKFSPAGGRVRFGLRGLDDHRIVIEVADSGPGVPKSQRTAIFDRFRQLEGGASRRFSGTGLGLSITRDFVALHRGEIAVGDAPEGGASFTVTLPRWAPPGTKIQSTVVESPESAVRLATELTNELRARPKDSDVPLGVSGAPLVLVVEDNIEMNDFLCDLLATRFAVACAFDGRQALDKTLTLRPDLVLTDIMMPWMGGDELIAALRKRPELADMPIVVLTAREDQAMRMRLLRGGAQDYVTKPFLKEEVLARIENLLATKRAQDSLRASEQRYRQLSTENGRLYETAQRAVKARDEVLRIIAHDLRNPLNSVLMNARLIHQQSAKKPTMADRRAFESIQRSVFRMSRMLQDLLDVARMDAGKYEVRHERVSATELVAELAEEEKPLVEAASLELRVDVPRDLPELSGDRERLLRVLENLVGNAIKFTTAGGRISLGAEPRGNETLFWVADTGRGIDPEHLSHLFDRFWQASDGAPSGAGLGLPIVQGIVEAHGGRVWVESVPGQGSTFFFTIPTAPPVEHPPC